MNLNQGLKIANEYVVREPIELDWRGQRNRFRYCKTENASSFNWNEI